MALSAARARRLRAGHLDGACAVCVGVAVWMDCRRMPGGGRVSSCDGWHASCSALTVVESDSQPDISSASTRRRRINRAVALWLALAPIALAMIVVGVFVSNVPLSSDMLRQSIVASLSER